MSKFPEPLNELIKQLSKLPGVGTKSAQRYAFYILGMQDDEVKAMSESIAVVKKSMHACPVCGLYTLNTEKCDICDDAARDGKILCVVASAKDVFYLDDSRNGYNGRFHVLGGVLSPINGVFPADLDFDGLVQRVKSEGIQEVIIATNPDVEGETTASYTAKLLKPLGVRVTRLAYGLPMGSNLEYADPLTLSLAIEGRRDVE